MKTQTKNFQKEKIDPFVSIKQRVKQYTINQRKVCAKYLGSTIPWLPVKPRLNIQYYYLDKTKKLGWCVNAKVRAEPDYKIILFTLKSSEMFFNLVLDTILCLV